LGLGSSDGGAAGLPGFLRRIEAEKEQQRQAEGRATSPIRKAAS
jgi:hypothetical protein